MEKIVKGESILKALELLKSDSLYRQQRFINVNDNLQKLLEKYSEARKDDTSRSFLLGALLYQQEAIQSVRSMLNYIELLENILTGIDEKIKESIDAGSKKAEEDLKKTSDQKFTAIV